MVNMDSTTTLYLVLTVVSLVVAIYSHQQKKEKREVNLAWAVFGIMALLLFINLSSNTYVSKFIPVSDIFTPQQVPVYVPPQSTESQYGQVVVPADTLTQGGYVPDAQYIKDEHLQELVPEQVKKQNQLDSLFNPLVDPSKLQNKSIYDVKDSTINPEDLMPSTDNDWSQLQSLVDIGLKDQNFLTPRHTGLNTVSTANKNACYDLRGTIPVPKVGHMPWGNSSYETEDSNKQLQLNIKL